MSKENLFEKYALDTKNNLHNRDIKIAMDDWAQQQSIAFYNWMNKDFKKLLEDTKGDKGEWIRLVQLSDESKYQLFLQTQ